jgi:hypothetical protein
MKNSTISLSVDGGTIVDEPKTGAEVNIRKEAPVVLVAMACHPRLGSYAVIGPVTGRSYLIERTVTSGIDLRDAEAIAASEVDTYCFITGGTIKIKPAGIIR